jgi:hypothetical protein
MVQDHTHWDQLQQDHTHWVQLAHGYMLGLCFVAEGLIGRSGLRLKAVCIRWPKVPLREASVLQTDLKIE